MVEDGKYQPFPWGQLVFSKLIKSLKQEFTSDKQTYRLSSMPYVLNVWMSECASEDIAGKSMPCTVEDSDQKYHVDPHSNIDQFFQQFVSHIPWILPTMIKILVYLLLRLKNKSLSLKRRL
ncbi:hypothetical protein RDI58_017562 [Solanum bulbocastanum]|uniref:Ulp1 protease family, C-terminal catalytic domain containing protein n=1 Tax=Solanum bulbocastanum TaxID=147425 RepID=A0AAN8YC46_SOLBU